MNGAARQRKRTATLAKIRAYKAAHGIPLRQRLTEAQKTEARGARAPHRTGAAVRARMQHAQDNRTLDAARILWADNARALENLLTFQASLSRAFPGLRLRKGGGKK